MIVEKTKEIKKFFHALFDETEGFIEIRTISNIGKVRREYYPISGIEQLVSHIMEEKQPHFKDTNIYHGVCPRHEKKGKERNVKQMNCLWIDLDCKSEKERFEGLKRLQAFELLPSIIISSGNGFHCYWLLNRPYQIKNDEDRLKAKGCLKGLALALAGDMTFDLSRILRVPGTMNLKDLHNPLPVEILEFDNEIRYEFQEFEQFAVDIKETPVPIDITLDKIPDRFWRILEQNEKLKATWEGRREDLKDESRSGYDMALADFLVLYGFSEDEIAAILRATPYNEKKELTRQYLGRTIGKAQQQKQRVEKVVEESKNAAKDQKTAKRKEKMQEQTKTLVPGLVHLVKEDGVVKYLLKKEDGIRIEERVVLGSVTFRPKQDLPIKMLGPDILNEIRSTDYGQLLEEVISFIKNYIEIPSDSHYLLLALWVLHTYIIDKFSSTPLLYFYGVKETGKSRAGEVLAELAFMCERLTSPTEATLFRGADYFKTCLVIDEIKLWGPQGNQDVARLINSRYKRGIKVTRVNTNKKGEDQIEFFDVFGPLVICTTESIPDTIESRCIVFLMQRNSRVEVESIIDEERARRLRNELTLFRADYFDKTLPQTDQVARRRLNEIMMPLYQIIMLISPEREGEFKETVQRIEKAKEEEEGMSLEAEIVEAIIKYQQDTNDNAFLTTELVSRLNTDRNDKEKLSERLVGMRVKRLGFEKTRLTNGKRGFKIRPELLETLSLRFDIDS